jgi:hypothetical protein
MKIAQKLSPKQISKCLSRIVSLAAVLALIIFGCSLSQARELNGVTMAEEMVVDGKKLVLNGMGLRAVTRFAIPVKVYVAGLYLESKSQDSYEILKSEGLKKIILHFVRPVDRDALIDAFRKGYEDGCMVECGNLGAQFTKIKEHIVSVRQNNQITFTFYPKQIEIDTNGPNAKKAMIEDANLSRNMLSLFINKNKPPTQELRSGLLGLQK